MRRGYPCVGETVRENNEPAGGRDVWRRHTHVIPRFTGDCRSKSRVVRPDDAEHARYAARLRQSLAALDGSPDLS